MAQNIPVKGMLVSNLYYRWIQNNGGGYECMETKKSGNLRGPEGRVKHLSVMLNKDKWTSKFH